MKRFSWNIFVRIEHEPIKFVSQKEVIVMIEDTTSDPQSTQVGDGTLNKLVFESDHLGLKLT